MRIGAATRWSSGPSYIEEDLDLLIDQLITAAKMYGFESRVSSIQQCCPLIVMRY